MKGVILAGGTGSRLQPLTSITNKHLLPIYNRPMIHYVIESLKSAGIKDILVITGTNHADDVFGHLGDGSDFGVNFTFKEQEGAGGLPTAISLAEEFVGDDKFISINGDNIIFESLKTFADKFASGDEEARIMLYEGTIEEAKKSGVAVMQGDTVKEVIEKPATPPSNLISVGIYMFTPGVFEIIKKLKPSARGETEISHVNNEYARRGTLRASKLTDMWLDAGDFDDLLLANVEVAKRAA